MLKPLCRGRECYGVARRPRDSATLPRGPSMVQICVPCEVRHELMSRASIKPMPLENKPRVSSRYRTSAVRMVGSAVSLSSSRRVCCRSGRYPHANSATTNGWVQSWSFPIKVASSALNLPLRNIATQMEVSTRIMVHPLAASAHPGFSEQSRRAPEACVRLPSQ
jgi:hypothetical protein